MATKSQFIASCKSAVVSKKIGLSFHHHTTDVQQRISLCVEICRARGIPGSEMAGRLLEHLAYASRITTSQFGAWDSNDTLANHLGWRNGQQVKRVKAKLVAAGLIETGVGIPQGRTAPTTHYRLTTYLGKLFRGLLRALKRTDRSYNRSKATNLKKPLLVPATKTASHTEFKPNPGRKPATQEVGGFYLGKIKALIGRGATA